MSKKSEWLEQEINLHIKVTGKRILQITKCRPFQVHVVFGNVETLDVGWCLCVVCVFGREAHFPLLFVRVKRSELECNHSPIFQWLRICGSLFPRPRTIIKAWVLDQACSTRKSRQRFVLHTAETLEMKERLSNLSLAKPR